MRQAELPFLQEPEALLDQMMGVCGGINIGIGLHRVEALVVGLSRDGEELLKRDGPAHSLDDFCVFDVGNVPGKAEHTAYGGGVERCITSHEGVGKVG